MRKFTVNLSLFFLFAGVLYILLLILFGTFMPRKLNKNLPYKLGGNGFLYTRLKEADTTKDIDVLILGSSHAYRGYDPKSFEKFGVKTFNLGSSAQTPLQTELLVNRYIYHLNPRLVIFDIYPVLFNSDGIESTLDLISNANMESDIWNLSLDAKNIKVYNTLLYSTYRRLFSLNKGYKEKLKNKEDEYIKGGYVQTNKTISRTKRYKEGSYQINSMQLESFKRIINNFKTRGINYIIVQAPILPARYNSINNNVYMDSILACFGTYYNFNSVANWPDSLFADDSHLNRKGVEVYNSQLLSTINLNKYFVK